MLKFSSVQLALNLNAFSQIAHLLQTPLNAKYKDVTQLFKL